jgi:hypothetical protein
VTFYYVFRRNDSTDLTYLGKHECNGPHQAIRALADGQPGIYAAAPVRNWTEVNAEIEQAEPRFVIGPSYIPDDVPQAQTALDEEQTAEEIAEEALAS